MQLTENAFLKQARQNVTAARRAYKTLQNESCPYYYVYKGSCFERPYDNNDHFEIFDGHLSLSEEILVRLGATKHYYSPNC